MSSGAHELNAKATEFARACNDEAAIHLYRAALAIKPNDDEALDKLGTLLKERGDLDETKLALPNQGIDSEILLNQVLAEKDRLTFGEELQNDLLIRERERLWETEWWLRPPLPATKTESSTLGAARRLIPPAMTPLVQLP